MSTSQLALAAGGMTAMRPLGTATANGTGASSGPRAGGSAVMSPRLHPLARRIGCLVRAFRPAGGQPVRAAFGAGLLAGLLLAAPAGVAAQQAPSTSEVAAYTGTLAAAHRGDVAALDKLLRQSPASLNARDAYGRTPLHVATFARQRAAVKALLAAGADTHLLENDRYDAVTIAAVADDEETLKLLLAGGASAKLVTSRYDGTALIAAAHLGHDGVVRQLIAAGAPLDHVNNLHWTALIEAVVLGQGGPRHQSVVKALLDAKANTALTDRDGRTPLQLARSRGYAALVALLEAAGAK